MLAGQPYRPSDPELVAARQRAREICARFNNAWAEEEQRAGLLRTLLGSVGANVWIEPPFRCDYGENTYIGDDVYLNLGCVLLDCCAIRIGHAVKFGPSVHVYTATHPLDPVERRSGVEMASPISVGDNAWIGGSAVLCPGIEIGENSVIGAGSVVTRSIPANVVAVGNPCRVIRSL